MFDVDPDRTRRLTEDLGKALFSEIPDGAAAVVLNFSEVGRVSGGSASAYSSTGDRINVDPDDSVFDLAEELRSAMYRPGAGTWFSAKITVTAQGSMDADFNYDDEPQWDEGIPDHWFVHDLEKFPREESAQPEWLKQKLAAAKA